MISIFENNHKIPRFHKKMEKYGDYILAVRNPKRELTFKEIRQEIELHTLLKSKVEESVYCMPAWSNTPQGRDFWKNYVDYIIENIF